jgi:hypothetical protein
MARGEIHRKGLTMPLEETDFQDVRLSRPVSVTDVWDIDDRIDRLQDAVNRLEKIVEALAEIYRGERVKSWEMILQGMLKEQERKKGNAGVNRTG